MRNLRLIHIYIAFFIDLTIQAQPELLNDIKYNLSTEISTSFGDNTPLWLNANKYGLSSLEKQNGYLRASLERPLETDSSNRWAVGYGLDIVGAYNYTSNIIIQQAFAEVRWLKGVLTVGSKQHPMDLKNQELSSGSQTLGINARPIPQVRLALPDYWELPFSKGWVSFKGHIAYGKMTDDNWQKDFTKKNSKYTNNVLYHSKAGFIKIGKCDELIPISFEFGAEMACQFAGTSYNVTAIEGGPQLIIKNPNGIEAFWDAFLPGGSDTPEVHYKNVSGNHLGCWMMRLNIDYRKWAIAIYGEHFFEDHSSMFFLDYDGYGSGNNWDEKVKNRYILYDLKDIMLGVELELKNFHYINNIVFEYLHTKYQSGPIYHDHNINISDHIGGIDDYYNHSIYTGWQHWGQVIGNPLYLSPIYNTDGQIIVKNNRFYAFHLGLSGSPLDNLNYRILSTYQKGYGTYQKPYLDPRNNISLMAEAEYVFPKKSILEDWSIKGTYGMDTGNIYGNNHGFQISIAKRGLLKTTRKK